MLPRILILLLASLVPLAAARGAATDVNPARSALTVLVTLHADTSGLQNADDRQATLGLPRALVPLVRYALYNRGWLMTVDSAGNSGGPHLDITVRASFVEKPVMTQSDNRRFFSLVDRYLSLDIEFRWQRGAAVRTDRIKQVGRTDWMRLDNPNSINVRFSPQRAEPAIFTLQRAVGRWHDRVLYDDDSLFLPDRSIDQLVRHTLPFTLIGDDPRGDLLPLASTSLLDLFDAALVDDRGESAAGTVGILELRPPRPDYALGLKFEELGNAYPGADTITVAQYPLVHPDLEFWRPYYSRLTLVHELAHTLGAIHVSDESSLMNHGLQHLSDDRFDPLNAAIVQAALDNRFEADDARGYVEMLARLLQSTGYRRADYPPIFSVYLTAAERDGDRKRIEAAIGRRSYIVAGDAYSALEQGDFAGAARLFRLALKDDPQQAALWYYLSKSTRGTESFEAMEQAARLGYFLAKLVYRK